MCGGFGVQWWQQTTNRLWSDLDPPKNTWNPRVFTLRRKRIAWAVVWPRGWPPPLKCPTAKKEKNRKKTKQRKKQRQPLQLKLNWRTKLIALIPFRKRKKTVSFDNSRNTQMEWIEYNNMCKNANYFTIGEVKRALAKQAQANCTLCKMEKYLWQTTSNLFIHCVCNRKEK